MDKKALQNYAVWAKTNLESQIEVSLKTLGINSEKDIKTARKVGEYTIIDGDSNSYPGDLKAKRDRIISLVKQDGYKQTIEEFAYTWFNRIVALRFMEVRDFLPHGFRVLSSRNGGSEPEILKNLAYVKDDLHLDMSILAPLMEQGKLDEAFRYVLFRQCNSLSGILPMLFERDDDYLELLLPKALLKGETFITKLLEIGEDDFLNDVEVIGWLYQFYVADDRQEFRDAKVVTKDLIPTLTQVFTPDWIVRYMAENSVGRIWLESYPNSSLKSGMNYYVEDAKQDEDVQRKIDEIKYKNVNPEDIRIIEPCCGSGHILVYVFDLLYKMYEEKGYAAREIPTLILKKNLVGLEIDKRAAQLASFSLIMKARSVNSRFFNDTYYTIPEVYEIWDSRALFYSEYKTQLEEMKLLSSSEMKDIEWLAETFRYAKTIGSLLKVEKKDFTSIKNTLDKIDEQAVSTIFNMNFLNEGMKCLRHLLRQAEVMSSKYDVMITNPPYLGISKMEPAPKTYLQNNYPDSKADMFAMFMEAPFVKKNGFISMVNPDSWMFLVSFENLRKKIINQQSIITMAHLGMGSFDATVQTTTFVIRTSIQAPKGKYFRLVDEKEKDIKISENNSIIGDSNDYLKLPSYLIAYWVSKSFIKIFTQSVALETLAYPRQGMATTNNNLFLRQWFEVYYNNIGFNLNDETETIGLKKWFPYNKGGEFRKWYGNNDYVVNFQNMGHEVCKYIDENSAVDHKGRVINRDRYFKPNITWSKISSGSIAFRFKNHCIFDVAGTSIFGNTDMLEVFICLLNSKLVLHILECLSPTLNYEVGQICSLPILNEIFQLDTIKKIAKENISISKTDWDSFETSWDFQRHPLVANTSLKESYLNWENQCKDRFDTLKANEEELNRIFIDIYGLQDELTPDVADRDVTVRLADKERDIKSLISYLIGVEMGRYSLDVDGLAYAGGEWNPMNYATYQPDDDGIIPVYTQLGMADGLTARIIKLIKHIYGEDTYKENIDFIADALGKNSNESSEETLNRYLNDGFYADHLKTYQKRPIYWMFSSGKNGAFKCLVYLHRYTEDTLAIINSKYFLNESARLNHEVIDTQAQLESADGREKLRLEKLYKVLSARQKEMIDYGQVLDHMANQYIKLDLDDGVKVNYEKFQNIEVVNENGAKVKKDLLVPIK